MHDDDEERQWFYDSLGLKEKRIVPQVLLHDDDGQWHRIGGYQALKISGVQSLRLLGLAWNPEAANQEQTETVEIRRSVRQNTPYFLVSPQDQFAVEVAEFWVEKAIPALGESHPKIVSARRRIAEIKEWQVMYGARHPE